MKKIILKLTFALFILPTITFSQSEGCQFNDGYIYFVLDEEGDYTNGYVQYELNYLDERILASSQCVKKIDIYPSCYVDNNIGGPSGYGTLVTFGKVNCPIDNYTWALLAFTIIPVFVHRNKLFSVIR